MRTLAICLFALLMVRSSATAQSVELPGAFTLVESIDDFDDTDRSAIYTMGEDSDELLALYWKCMSDGLNIVIEMGRFYAGDRDDEILVRYRFDRIPAHDFEYWPLLQASESAYMPMKNVKAFTTEALSAQSVMLEAVDPLDNESHRTRFELDGLAGALARLSCYQ